MSHQSQTMLIFWISNVHFDLYDLVAEIQSKKCKYLNPFTRDSYLLRATAQSQI